MLFCDKSSFALLEELEKKNKHLAVSVVLIFQLTSIQSFNFATCLFFVCGWITNGITLVNVSVSWIGCQVQYKPAPLFSFSDKCLVKKRTDMKKLGFVPGQCWLDQKRIIHLAIHYILSEWHGVNSNCPYWSSQTFILTLLQDQQTCHLCVIET